MIRTIRTILVLCLCLPPVATATEQATSGVIGSAYDVNLNAVGETQVALKVESKFRLRGILFTDCTNTDNAGVLQGTIHTAPSGGGTNIGTLGPSAIVDSTSPPNHPELVHDLYSESHPESLRSTFTVQSLYVRVTTARGAAMTCDVYVVADVLP